MSIFSRIKTFSYRTYILIGLVLCLVPILTSAGVLKMSTLTILGGVLIYTFAAIGLDLLLGYSGLISLGTAGFMGLGAYMTAYFTEDIGMPFLLSLVLSVGIPVLVGVFIGFISLKVEGFYLAIATLCVSEIFKKSFEELDAFTGGFSGKSLSYPEILPGIELSQNATFVMIVVLLVVFMCIVHNISNGYYGRAFLAMKGSENAASAMGIKLLRYRLFAFGIATMFAALSGVLYAHFITFVYPTTWTMGMSLSILAIIIIGGMRSLPGALIGSLVVFGIPDLVLKKLPIVSDIEGLPHIVNGVLIIVVIMFYPGGLVGIWRDIKKMFKKKEGSHAKA